MGAQSVRNGTHVSTGVDLLDHALHHWPDTEAIVYPHSRCSFAELRSRAWQYARSLLGIGVRSGERVGILMPNCPEFLQVFFACHLIGAIPVTVNARYKPKELRHVFYDAELVAVITSDISSDFVSFTDLLNQTFVEGWPPKLRELVMLGASSPETYRDRTSFLDAATLVPERQVAERANHVGPQDVAVVMYTSGTTADPRGCPLTHRALLRTAGSAAERLRLTKDDRFWNPLPLFHMGGLLPTVACFRRGATVISMVHFDTDAALKQLQHERVTFAYPTFPTITQDIVHSPGSASADLSRIRGVLDTAPPEVLADIQRAFPQAKVVSSYGLTEAGGVVTYGHLDDPPERRFATAGRPFDGMSVRIVDPETGTQLGPMEPGEIRVAGVGMFEGYLNDSTHAAAQTDEQGYLKTGDLGYLDDDGRIAYTGRLKDMLKVAGENVAAAEVEAHLASHPAVKIAQVVGAPDRRLIEVPVAFVELVDGHEATEQELITHCRTALASFKVPRHVEFVRQWPMSATKIQKFRLREAVSAAGECASASSLAARINTQ